MDDSDSFASIEGLSEWVPTAEAWELGQRLRGGDPRLPEKPSEEAKAIDEALVAKVCEEVLKTIKVMYRDATEVQVVAGVFTCCTCVFSLLSGGAAAGCPFRGPSRSHSCFL